MGGKAKRGATLLAGSVLALLGLGAVAVAQDAEFVLNETGLDLRGRSENAIELDVRQDAFPRFTWDAPIYSANQTSQGMELEIAAGGGDAPIDIAIAQRAGLSGGDVESRRRGSELRIGSGLVDRRENEGGRAVYAFIASDDEALTWQPGARSDFGGRGNAVALQQNQVQVGDASAGVTYENNGVQTSLAYVERKTYTQVGTQGFTQEESFAGVTVTVRN
jgi:hypothetical protein